MAGRAQSFQATREERGLPSKVFSDPRNRRARRLLSSFAVLMLLTLGWLTAFSFALVSNQQAASAFPEELVGLKQQFSEPRYLPPTLLEAPRATDALDHDYSRLVAAAGRCTKPREASDNSLKVYAVVPSELPFAENSLSKSCGTIDVLLPSWYGLNLIGGELVLEDVGEDAQEPVRAHVRHSGHGKDIVPIIRLGQSTRYLIETEEGRARLLDSLDPLVQNLSEESTISGLCLQGGALEEGTYYELGAFLGPFADRLSRAGLKTCAVFSAHVAPSTLQAADRFVETIVAEAFQKPWVGSAPRPMSSLPYFEARVQSVRKLIKRAELVIALGTQSVAWVSGKPTPETLPYAELMRQLAVSGTTPIYEPMAGSSRTAFVGDDGRHRQVWLADVASAANQLSFLKGAGLGQVAISGLGYEDPGIWQVLDTLKSAEPIDPQGLREVLLDGYVSFTGEGPFVSPRALPVPGRREITVDPKTGRVTGMSYDQLPQPSLVHLYGRTKPGEVVLTFDDGPVAAYTPRILDTLKEYGVPGSFFVLGQNALQAPSLVDRILAEGHELGSHTYWHSNMSAVSPTRARVEVNSVQNLITGITGRKMLLYREPYMRSGVPISSRKVASLMPVEKAGYVIAGMDIVPRDWLDLSADELAADIIRQVEERGGGVVLLHDGGGDQSATVEALPMVITELRRRGYEFGSLADQLGVGPEQLLPEADFYAALFQKGSFLLVGKSWSALQIAFWGVLAIGSLRAVFMLLLTWRRQKHSVNPGEGYLTATVVIPAFNEEKVIERCIDHVLSSDYPHFNVVVVDDGSDDRTYELALKYERSPKVRVFSQFNRGKASALNRALDETDREVLICIDADSQIHRKAISHLMAHFNDPRVGAVAGRVVVGNRHNILTCLQALEYITAQSIERRAKEIMNAIPVVPGAIGAWRTNAILEAGIFSSETSTEDADMTMAVIRSDYRVVYEEKALATTEAPRTIGGLLQQRLRWNLGMMQAGWKHLGAYREKRALGLLSLTDLALFGYLMPLLAPLADLFLVILAVGGVASLMGAVPVDFEVPTHLLVAYLFLPTLDFITALVAFKLDPKEDRRLLLLFPIQRLLYRPLLYISVYRSVWRALSGTLARWGSVARAGYRFDQERVA